jgi:structural maintenance of chromosome 4
MVRRKAHASPPTAPRRKRRSSDAQGEDEFQFDSDDNQNDSIPAEVRKKKPTSSEHAAAVQSPRSADEQQPTNSESDPDGAAARMDIADALQSLAEQQNRNESMLSEDATTADEEGTTDLLSMKIPDKPEPIMRQDGSGTRLMITNITVDNFKSYFGRQELGPFHHVRSLFQFLFLPLLHLYSKISLLHSFPIGLF